MLEGGPPKQGIVQGMLLLLLDGQVFVLQAECVRA